MKKLKWYWHIHYDILLEPLTEPLEERIKFIKEQAFATGTNKRKVDKRLKLLKPVKGKIPEEIIRAWNDYLKIDKKYDKSEKRCIETIKNHNKKAYYEALKNDIKIGEEYNRVRNNYIKMVNSSAETQSLHQKECSDCPWDSKSIFKEII